jgi:hypothetical protein
MSVGIGGGGNGNRWLCNAFFMKSMSFIQPSELFTIYCSG